MRLQAAKIADADSTQCGTADEVLNTWSIRNIQEWAEVQKIAEKEFERQHGS